MSRTVIVLFTLALAACGGGSAGGSDDGDGGSDGPGPCEGASPDPTCGETCTSDISCGVGFHCEGGACTAECTVGGDQCGDGEVCDGRGRCVSDDPGEVPDPNCPDVIVDASQVIPAVELIIDWSLSMDADFGRGNRAEATRAALTGATGVVTRLQGQVIFGATVYSSENGDRGGTCPLVETVGRDFNTASAIDAKLDLARFPLIDDTPTAETIDAVVRDFAANPAPAGATPVIVLATDGEPDTCVNPDDHTTGPRNSVAAAQRARAAGIPLYILSVGDEVSEAHLQQMANAGLGLDPATGDAPFFVANDPAQLARALEQILGTVRSCDIELDATLEAGAAAQGTVSLDGQELEFGTDWEQVDGTTIRLLGDACDLLLDTGAAVTATFPCGTVVD
jgi:hypothetical protein